MCRRNSRNTHLIHPDIIIRIQVDHHAMLPAARSEVLRAARRVARFLAASPAMPEEAPPLAPASARPAAPPGVRPLATTDIATKRVRILRELFCEREQRDERESRCGFFIRHAFRLRADASSQWATACWRRPTGHSGECVAARRVARARHQTSELCPTAERCG